MKMIIAGRSPALVSGTITILADYFGDHSLFQTELIYSEAVLSILGLSISTDSRTVVFRQGLEAPIDALRRLFISAHVNTQQQTDDDSDGHILKKTQSDGWDDDFDFDEDSESQSQSPLSSISRALQDTLVKVLDNDGYLIEPDTRLALNEIAKEVFCFIYIYIYYCFVFAKS